jgi:hypothetical protein
MLADGSIEFRVEPSIGATSVGCSNATLQLQFSYTRAVKDCDQSNFDDSCQIIRTGSQLDCDGNGLIDACDPARNRDCNGNGLFDVCEIALGAEDINVNWRLDTCELLFGDLNLDGRIDGSDLSGLLALWGITNPPYGDLDGNQRIDGADLAAMLSRWGVIN